MWETLDVSRQINPSFRYRQAFLDLFVFPLNLPKRVQQPGNRPETAYLVLRVGTELCFGIHRQEHPCASRGAGGWGRACLQQDYSRRWP